MAWASFNQSADQMVDEYWLNQYDIWSKVKWSLLAFNVVTILVGFGLLLKNKYCAKDVY